MTSKDLALKICAQLQKSGITNILAIDVSHKTDIAKFFVVGTAKNVTLSKTACEELEQKLEPEGIFADRKEGQKDGKWIVVDYDNVIVHVFHTDMRDFYNFEKLWSDPSDANIIRQA